MKRSLLLAGVILAIFARILLININSAEWGDSYSILRASNFIQQFSYPSNEKRPPLFSIVLAVRPNNVDAVLWGRLVMLGISFLSIYMFYKLSKKYLATQNQRLLALVLLALNPVYLYWSLRIYADVPFSLLVLMCFYAFELWREKINRGDKQSILYLAVMGVICGLGILTRFEGYLLTLATLAGTFVIGRGNLRNLIRIFLPFVITILIIIIPWLLYRNPLTSSYFEETTGRKYNLDVLLTYLISYIFVLGIVPAGAFVVTHLFRKPLTSLPGVFRKYPHLVTFVLLESLLILAWPAAVPRLFVPIIPFLVIALVKSVDVFNKNFRVTVIASIILIATYIVTQNHLRLQFLGSHTLVFMFVSVVSIVGIVTIFLNRRKLFIFTAILSMLALSTSTIYLHKDIYRSIKDISGFSAKELHGKVIHNDTAGIVNWYLPQSDYKNLDDKKYLTQTYLQENRISYIILTNEFNPKLEVDLAKRPYLQLIKESKHALGGKMFFTWLIQVRT